jgi:hypothetical protein
MDSANFVIDFVIGALATWRISHLLVHEDGPANLAARVRAHFAGSEIGRLLDCLGCASLAVALPVALFVSRRPLGLLPISLALSGAAFLLERIGGQPLVIERIVEPPHGADHHDLLRTETGNPSGRAVNPGERNFIDV